MANICCNQTNSLGCRNSGSLYVSREILLEHAYFTEENQHKGIGQKHHNILMFMDMLTMNIAPPWYAPPEEGIEGNKRAKTTKNFTQTEVELVVRDMQNGIYDFLRDDKDFAALNQIST